MKFILFVFCYFAILPSYSQKRFECINTLVDEAFSTEIKGDFYLFLPVETMQYEKARLMIKKSHYLNYLLAFDSIFIKPDTLKEFTKKVLMNKQRFFFDEFFYKEYFQSTDFVILTKKNSINITNKHNQEIFIKKYLAIYNKKGDFYLLNYALDNPERRYKFICENLFLLNYLVVEGESEIVAVPVKCQ